MSISRDTTIEQLYLSAAGMIKAVQYSWVFTDDSKPGVESTHGGTVGVEPAGLLANASIQAIAAAVETAMQYAIDGLMEFHANRLAFLYDVKTSTAVIVRPIVENDVIAERLRRLSVGFDYDFGGARGVHHIATTPEDLQNWDEVTKLAAACIASGNPDAQIAIKTDTGGTTVTAMEWQGVLLAAGAFRQPIFAASFALQAMSPIPSDYASASYWPAQV
jgi:hypothetical protein